MWEKIVNLAISNGLWAVMFMFLLIFLIRDSSRREAKYQQTIQSLNTSLGIVKEIKQDVQDIKQDMQQLTPSKGLKCVKKEAV